MKENGLLRRRWLTAAFFAALVILPRVIPATAATIEVEVVDDKGGPVANAAVYAVPAAGKPPPPELKQVVVDQADREFLPELTVVPVNTPVVFPNSDKIRHHVYSLSKVKSFELPLYIGTPPKPVVFDKPGVVALGCNIHDWMMAYIYIVDTPWSAKTDARGKTAIEGLPEGQYEVTVWHPRLKDETMAARAGAWPAAQVAEGQTEKAVVTGSGAAVRFEIKLRPDWRIRRATAHEGHRGY